MSSLSHLPAIRGVLAKLRNLHHGAAFQNPASPGEDWGAGAGNELLWPSPSVVTVWMRLHPGHWKKCATPIAASVTTFTDRNQSIGVLQSGQCGGWSPRTDRFNICTITHPLRTKATQRYPDQSPTPSSFAAQFHPRHVRPH
jgi:hypothetical protein